MPNSVVQSVSCPACRHVSDFTAYESINVGEHPELLGPLLRNQLFTFICPKCGDHAPVSYDLLYHDPKTKGMIWLIQDENEQVPEDDESPKKADGYTRRRVFTTEELIEKAQIWRDRLDDRVMELLKLAIAQNLVRQNPDMQGLLHYAGLVESTKMQLAFRVTTETGVSAMAVTMAEYATFEKKYVEKLPVSTENLWPMVDQQWAIGVVKS